MPPSVTAEPSSWAVLSARDAGQWQAQEGIGAARAARLVEFFGNDDVRAQAARLHAAGVRGF